ncbi:MAG: mammalian cell entry protein [Flavobacteriales bacterium]|mgnify:CR=1 FL=1|nr:mammalian cell entry protein [Flavobacteriales bacterium]|tara:strand:- start:31000 stop:31959 length:960 start_codon:yes stop_codon:yes gene_type:complete
MNKELKIGFVAIVTIALLFIGINFLKGLNVLNSARKFYSLYENIGGLQVGSSVLVNGYQVGMVSDINLLTEESQRLLVEISIEKDFNIPSNSICKIVNQDLMGTKGISLLIGNDEIFALDGDTLRTDIEGTLQDEVNAQILPLKHKAEELIGSIDSVMVIITAVLNKDTRENLRNSLQSLDKTFALMSETMSKVDSLVLVNDERLTKIIFNLESITSNLAGGNNEIRTILTNFASISDSLAKADITSVVEDVNHIVSSINEGEGSIGLLLKDEKVYANLEQSTKQLAELIEDIKKNPSRYVNFSIIGGSKGYKTPKTRK